MSTELSRIMKAGVIAGVSGWAIENAYTPNRYSWVMGGERAGIPFLPVFALGGAVLAAVAPRLQSQGDLTRLATYSVALGGLEWAVCKADRALGHCSWDYEGACVDAPHALAWGALAMLVEPLITGRVDPGVKRLGF